MSARRKVGYIDPAKLAEVAKDPESGVQLVVNPAALLRLAAEGKLLVIYVNED